MTFFSDLQYRFKQGDILIKLLIINGFCFSLLWIIEIIGNIFSPAIYQAVLANISAPTFIGHFIQKPWTVFTFLLFDTSFWSLFCNMLILLWTGRIFIDIMDEKKLLATYILGGLTGLVLTLCVSTPTTSVTLLSPTAAVLAVMTAIATYSPNYKVFLLFFGEVSLKVIAIIFIAIECIPLLSLANGMNTGLILAANRLGGILYGFLWVILLKKGTDISHWFLVLLTNIENATKKKTKMRVKRHKDESYVSYEEVKYDENEIDKILAKISKSGYDSLTKKEKETLFKQKK